MIDKTKPKWKTEPNSKNWVYKGYDLSIKRNEAECCGHLCGYIDIEEPHPWFGKVDNSIAVHGGVTFAGMSGEVWKIGFDCAHYGDLMPGMQERFGPMRAHESYRDMEYVQHECESLADQAVKANTWKWLRSIKRLTTRFMPGSARDK